MLAKFSHIILSLVFLVSTVDMTFSLHFSNGELYDIGVFSHANSCCADNDGSHSTCMMHQKDMDCEDSELSFEASNKLALDLEVVKNNIVPESMSVIPFIISLFQLSETTQPHYITQSPPLLPNGNDLSFFQSFLL